MAMIYELHSMDIYQSNVAFFFSDLTKSDQVEWKKKYYTNTDGRQRWNDNDEGDECMKNILQPIHLRKDIII